MPTTWAELLDLGDREAPGAAVAEGDDEPKRRGFFRRLRESISTSREALSAELSSSLFETLDAAAWEQLEEALIMADVGARTTAEVVQRLEHEVDSGKVVGGEAARERLVELLADLATTGKGTIDLRPRPAIVLVVGVNGTGKTTTIGKIAAGLRREGRKVVIAAGDTFRAAAIDQLKVWGERTGCPVVARKVGSDASGLAFDALKEAAEQGADVLLVDTAGRLQNKAALMDELEKVIRVMRKLDPSAPHDVLLVLDATTGQNALSQVEVFRERAGVTGLVMTKLDGTARGGILVAISAKYGLPVHAIGVGEGIDDLQPFDAAEFARAIALS